MKISKKRVWNSAGGLISALLLLALAGIFSGKRVLAQTGNDSRTCMECHTGIESMHSDGDSEIGITCVDCHGGNGQASSKKKAHIEPQQKDIFKSSANPQNSYAALNRESPEFIRFMNPGDFRIADQTCGKCHEQILNRMLTSIMSHSAMIPQAGTYNNGIVDSKIALFGESYLPDGTQAVLSTPESEAPETNSDGLPKNSRINKLLPFPHFGIVPATDAFRVLERGNNDAGTRGPGTDFHVAGGGIVLNKTRLNDPYLWFIGPSVSAGDYRNSGCTACHVLYGNDRDRKNSGPELSKFYDQGGKSGHSASNDQSIPKDEPGHPVAHRMTKSIPVSQCLTCHHHQGSGALGNFVGAMWWDQESDADKVFEPGKYRDKLISEEKRQALYAMNKDFDEVQLADWHGHSWNYQNVYSMDRKGNFLDADGNIVAPTDPEKFKKAVHLQDIHFQKGMHCIDCHTEQDVHGSGVIWGAMIDAIEIRCEDCHGTAVAKATLTTSGVAASGNNNLADQRSGDRTPFGKRVFEWKQGKLIQRSKIDENLKWEVPQLVDMIVSGNTGYSAKASRAHSLQTDGITWGKKIAGGEELAHSADKMECYTCHSAWNTQCYGCHLSAQVNTKQKGKHYEGNPSLAEVAYSPQVLRADAFMIGINGVSKGNKYSPMRSASAVLVTVRARNRQVVVHQQPTISASGHSGFAVTPNPPHTVRTAETKRCTDCHISENNDNNAWLASVYGFGTNATTFVGEYAYVAQGKKGFQAIKVTEGWEPQPVIGSEYHRILHPESFQKFIGNKRRLKTAYGAGSKKARSIATIGEWVFVADGPGGFKVFDRANVGNKNAAQRIVAAQNSRFGQKTSLSTKDATCVALPSNTPMNAERKMPQFYEKPVADLFRYAYITDSQEGLITVNIQTFSDNDPQNNYIKRAATYNPGGRLTGAVKIKIAGNYAYIMSKTTGFHVVDISNPRAPKWLAAIESPDIIEGWSLDIQFRYAFIVDKEGFKVIDISDPASPQLVEDSWIKFTDARGVYVVRTYAYVAAGREGLGIVDVEKPDAPQLVEKFSAGGKLSDAYALTTGTVNASMFAFVADGKNGLQVVRLTGPPDTPGHLGFSPQPVPKLIATYRTKGDAVAIAEGAKRDRATDENGNQIGVSGQLGSYPLARENIEKLTLKDGKIYTVKD